MSVLENDYRRIWTILHKKFWEKLIGSGRVNCCWLSPAQSILVPGPELMIIVYCLTTLPSEELVAHFQSKVPAFISPRNRVARLYPQALGSVFVASYDSQGYGGGI
jgi:hypothetical protein